MKKYLLLIIITSLFLPACSWFDSESDKTEDATRESNYSPLKTPEKIEGLYVGTCPELFDDMKKNDKQSTDDELYRAAAVILFSDARPEDANECCNNITDKSLKEACKR